MFSILFYQQTITCETFKAEYIKIGGFVLLTRTFWSLAVVWTRQLSVFLWMCLGCKGRNTWDEYWLYWLLYHSSSYFIIFHLISSSFVCPLFTRFISIEVSTFIAFYWIIHSIKPFHRLFFPIIYQPWCLLCGCRISSNIRILSIVCNILPSPRFLQFPKSLAERNRCSHTQKISSMSWTPVFFCNHTRDFLLKCSHNFQFEEWEEEDDDDVYECIYHWLLLLFIVIDDCY